MPQTRPRPSEAAPGWRAGVATFSALPTTGVRDGEVWRVLDTDTGWTWDAVSSTWKPYAGAGLPPGSHASTHASIGSDTVTPAAIDAEPAFSKNTAFNKNFGTNVGEVAQGNDARIPTQSENDALVGTSGTPSGTNKFVTNTDPRNSDARTPTAHAISHEGGADAVSPAGIGAEPAFAKNTAFNKNFGAIVGTVTEGNDSRLSDARTPTAHAASHEGGADAVSPAGIGAESAFAKNTAFNKNFGNAVGTVLEGNNARVPTGDAGAANGAAILDAALTTGSIPFADAGGTGKLAQDNASLFWDRVNKRLGIGTATPNASAILDLTSTTKGFLPPRMTAVQRDAIATPAAGLTIYDTTNNKADFYNGTVWRAFVSTDISTFVVGSIPFATGAHHLSDDNANLFWDNVTKRLGIGTPTPSESLHVDGQVRVDRVIFDRPGSVQSSYIEKGSAGVAKGIGFYTLSTERMSILEGGNVGINSTNPTSKLQVVGLVIHANNAAAVAGGLTVGAFYRTGGDPDPVCVVH